VIVLSDSRSFERHLRGALPEQRMSFCRSLRGMPPGTSAENAVCLVHLISSPVAVDAPLIAALEARGLGLAIASDEPRLEEFLRLSRFRLLAYLNSYMADLHYRQMLQVVAAGQAWVVPPILDEALHRARSTAGPPDVDPDLFAALTPRQRDVAVAVSEGLSNPEIAARLGITEATVKVHLGRVFKKLGTRNRYALALKLQDLALAS
jgi:DNA-binding NarL/FixJ family response regulator